ncbi:cystatin-B-like [Tiliqua scincoides]|uniref:cystatin-B-like n=1 Tax=Tiliqua scincoides TaxID=71010 RepID=UPI003462808B
MSVGGLSPTQPATAAVQAITDQVRSQLESRENQTFAILWAIEYRTQVVAGNNYFIKVQYGDGTHSYAHLRVFQALPVNGGQVELQGCQLRHTRTDPLTYF